MTQMRLTKLKRHWWTVYSRGHFLFMYVVCSFNCMVSDETATHKCFRHLFTGPRTATKRTDGPSSGKASVSKINEMSHVESRQVAYIATLVSATTSAWCNGNDVIYMRLALSSMHKDHGRPTMIDSKGGHSSTTFWINSTSSTSVLARQNGQGRRWCSGIGKYGTCPIIALTLWLTLSSEKSSIVKLVMKANAVVKVDPVQRPLLAAHDWLLNSLQWTTRRRSLDKVLSLISCSHVFQVVLILCLQNFPTDLPAICWSWSHMLTVSLAISSCLLSHRICSLSCSLTCCTCSWMFCTTRLSGSWLHHWRVNLALMTLCSQTRMYGLGLHLLILCMNDNLN